MTVTDWKINEEQMAGYVGKRNLTLTDNLTNLYGVKSIVKQQEKGNKVTYTVTRKGKDFNSKDVNITFRCKTDPKSLEENDVSDLEMEFENIKGESKIRLKIYWQVIEEDLYKFFGDEYDSIDDHMIRDYLKNNPEYGENGENALREILLTYEDLVLRRCPACGLVGWTKPEDYEKHMKNKHRDYLEFCKMDKVVYPSTVLILKPEDIVSNDNQLVKSKWITVAEYLNGMTGYIIAKVHDITNQHQVIWRTFLYCQRCFYHGKDIDPDGFRYFGKPVNASEIHEYIPCFDICPQCNGYSTIIAVNKAVPVFDMVIKDHKNNQITVPVQDCIDFGPTKGDLVIIHGDETSPTIRGQVVKGLKAKRVQVITSEFIKSMVGGNRLLTETMGALPDLTVDQTIAKSVVTIIEREAPKEVKLEDALIEIFRINADIRTSKIFKFNHDKLTMDTSINKPLREFIKSLPKKTQKGVIIRTKQSPATYKLQSTIRKLPDLS